MTNAKKTVRPLNGILWGIQIILALSFLWAGSMKLFQSTEKLAGMWAWTAEHPNLVTATGILDLLAGLGLLLPVVFRSLSGLTIATAFGCIALMLAASLFHIARGEGAEIGVNIVFAILAGCIAWGRLRSTPDRSTR